ncbi:hypothetical protein [Chitinophaga barathri]|uniref:Uncharacterized protein n=1 Tax=Chitinophaga barathri TaxID=1647451 RepID=A0A3N4MV42_9BACT|nr:hypothetical protein [Chitinophaga barathri]RPD39333.1 hypothetical protein EG028_19595 [Chitinophaga barathri]
MKKAYALEWLDHVITKELDPNIAGQKPITEEKVKEIRDRIEQEEDLLLARLKQRVFRLHDETESRALVKKYHDSLLLMITRNHDYQQHPMTRKLQHKDLHIFLGIRLQRILGLFELEFSAFLGLENRVALTRLVEQKNFIEANRETMRLKLSTGEHGMAPVDIVLGVLDEFLSKIDDRLPVTLREFEYIRLLTEDVLKIDGNLTSITGCPALNELLIYWNLNSIVCIRYFTMGTEQLMNSYLTALEKLEFLKLELKKLQIIPEKQDFILNPDFPSVKEYCGKWLQNEIEYRENKLQGFAPLAQEVAAKSIKVNKFKVVVQLSADQIGLILRAADDTRLLQARSMSAVFKAIVPSLSSPYNEDLSWDNIRTKAYVAEHSDKAAAAEVLKKMVDRIHSY